MFELRLTVDLFQPVQVAETKTQIFYIEYVYGVVTARAWYQHIVPGNPSLKQRDKDAVIRDEQAEEESTNSFCRGMGA